MSSSCPTLRPGLGAGWGLVCNLMVRPLADKWFMTDAELAEEKRLAHEKAAASELQRGGGGGDAVNPGMAVLAWLAVGIPLAWGFTARCKASQNSSTDRLFFKASQVVR